jgi:hypothetical protein
MKALRLLIVAVFVMNTSIAAQWLKHPTPDIPRTADGKPDLSAPTPRQPNGKPVLAGLWRPAPGIVGDMTRGMKSGEVVPFQPWAEAVFKARRANDSRDDPTAKCIVGGVPRFEFRRLSVQDHPSGRRWSSSCTRPCMPIGRSSRMGERCRRNPIPHGSAIQLGAGTETRSSSSRVASTTMYGSTMPAVRRRSS